MNRAFQLCGVLALGLMVASCGGNSNLDDGEATVYLTVDIDEYNPDIDICSQTFDISVTSMSIDSRLKNPAGAPSPAMDVTLTRWVVTPYRTDGGSTSSPEWSYDQSVYVPVGGTTDLNNYRVYPLENLSEIPLAYLLPENGGFDPETGNRNIRQSLQLQIFGQTNGGKRVATNKVPIGFNFYFSCAVK